MDSMPIDLTNPHVTKQGNMQMNNECNEWRFFHNTLDDGNIYHITCKIILQDSVSSDDHNYDHVFFHQCPAANYFVTCELLSRSLIVNILNRKFYGMNLDANNTIQKESLSLIQKLRLEQELKQVLSFYLKIDGNMNSFHGHELSMTNNQLLNQNEVSRAQQQFDFAQHIPDIRVDSNIMTTQAVSMTVDIQNNFNDGLPQQSVVHSQQQDYNNFPQHPTHERETVSGYNTNFENNVTSQAVPATDINDQNYNYNDDYIVYPQQQVNPNNFQQHQISQISADRGTRLDYTNYNIMAAKSVSMFNDNSLSCNDHQDGVGDITYPQQQVNPPQHDHTSEGEIGPGFNNLLTGNVRNNETHNTTFQR